MEAIALPCAAWILFPSIATLLYYLYYFRMRAEIEQRIRGRRRERGPLPSVREIAMEFGASPRTVHTVLRRLSQEGIVHAIERKGFFWGVAESLADRPVPETAEDRFAVRFLADLRQGVYHPWKALPPRKALAQIYGIGIRSVGRALEGFAQRGVLELRGRDAFPSSPTRHSPNTSVLVVVRCDPKGAFLLDTEREIDFLKSVRRELAEQELGMIRIGYSEQDGGRFLDQGGREIDPSRLRGALLGAIVSTWLVIDPLQLLGRLEPLKIPLSVWWEHAADAFPRKRFRAGLAGFNLSFGESAGTAVGRHLVAHDLLDVAFLSPYHGNDWSPARLLGLKASLHASGGTVREFVASEFHSPWDLQRRSGSTKGMHLLLDRILLDFLRNREILSCPTWVMVNDLATTAMHRLLRERADLEPHLISFDNSSDSERLGFDSFEFHTDGMVRQMLHHLANPKANLFADAPIHEMIGRLVVRSAHPLHPLERPIPSRSPGR